MKKFSWFFLIALIAVVTSCSSSRMTAYDAVKDTVWFNFTPATLDGQEGVLLNSVCFTADSMVVMKTGVAQGSEVILPPTFSSIGTYKCYGKLKKGIIVDITTDIATIGKKVNYKGLITKEGMILIEPDSTYLVYNQANTIIK